MYDDYNIKQTKVMENMNIWFHRDNNYRDRVVS